MTDALLVGLDEAAQRLGVSRRLVQQLVYDGELPSVSVGRRRLIATADLVAFVDRRRQESQNANDREAWQPAVVQEGIRRARPRAS